MKFFISDRMIEPSYRQKISQLRTRCFQEAVTVADAKTDSCRESMSTTVEEENDNQTSTSDGFFPVSKSIKKRKHSSPVSSTESLSASDSFTRISTRSASKKRKTVSEPHKQLEDNPRKKKKFPVTVALSPDKQSEKLSFKNSSNRGSTMLQCLLCIEKIGDPRLQLTHALKHAKMAYFLCSECDFAGSNNDADPVRRHIEQMHKNKGKVVTVEDKRGYESFYIPPNPYHLSNLAKF